MIVMVAAFSSGAFASSEIEVQDCSEARIGIDTIVAPAAKNSCSFYNGEVHAYNVDVEEPAVRSTGIAIVMPYPEGDSSENQCEFSALKLAKAIRMVEMPWKARKAEFRIASTDITSESETYTIEMLVRGEKTMVDQRLVMVGGASCVLASYDMPGAG